MRQSFILSGLFMLFSGIIPCAATPVQIKMNSTSETMELVSESGNSIDVGTPSDRTYQFDVTPGSYVLTAYEADGTANGTIVVNVVEQQEQQVFEVFTHSLYATNKDTEGKQWQYGIDYTVDANVVSREGVKQTVTIGDNSTDGRKSILTFSGNTVYLTFNPSEVHVAEGYMSCSTFSTITFNVNLGVEIPMGLDYKVSIPTAADVQIGLKGAHFTEFSVIEPKQVEIEGEVKTLTYRLSANQKYNLRTWKSNGLTQALYFRATENGSMTFSDNDFTSYDPKQVNHDVSSNRGYETGDIFVNINERNHLVMNVGDTFDALSMRTWQLTDTQVDNYFFEPDFHYTILDVNGNPSTGVIEISTDNTTSPWRTINAVGDGTAIVLVTYDAIKVSRPDEDQVWMGGEYWGAIWPENTAVYVVSVGNSSSAIQPNMVVNEKYNIGEDGTALLKLAGKYVDAEHDVFYYLDTENGYNFSFIPEGAVSVTLAYPTIGENSATYTGFATDGVTHNEDGSYTLLLKKGRNIVCLTDASGKSVYQVLTAKPCHRDITNETRAGSDVFYAGDKVKIQYSGLFHPANKLAGIYNMSAYVTYNGNPNGTSLILGAGQYTFGSAASAQAVEFVIPEDYDVESQPLYVMDDGVIQVNGYGDPIGNHRNIDKYAGRSPNFTAVPHKTYFGSIPDVVLQMASRRYFSVQFDCNAPKAVFVVSKDGEEYLPTDDGKYSLASGEYSIFASADNHHCYRGSFAITDEMDENVTIPINMEYSLDCWNGTLLQEPALVDNVYQISNGAELAWLANFVNNGGENQNAILITDIDLGDYEWTPIGINRSNAYIGNFIGNNHTISHLYVTSEKNANNGFFGCVGKANKFALIEGIEVYGLVSSQNYECGGIAAHLEYGTMSKCANHANVSSGGTACGVAGYVCDTSTILDCYNTGDIYSESLMAGIAGDNLVGLTIKNVFNVGKISGMGYSGPCALDPWDGNAGDLANLYAIEDADNNWLNGQFGIDGSEIVSSQRMASGEIAYRLGKAFGQTIGENEYPVLNGPMVYKVNYTIIDSAEEISTLSDDNSSIYTNGSLPNELNGEEAHWFIDEAMTQPVSSVESDSDLFVRLGSMSGITDIPIEEGTNEKWFNIQGVEVPKPSVDTHGIFIHVINGKSEKVVL